VNISKETILSQKYLTEMIGYASIEGGISNEPDIFEAKRRIEALNVRTQPQGEKKKLTRENNQKGLKYSQAGKFTDAVQAFQEAYQANPGDVEVVNNLGTAYLVKGDLNGAEQFLRKALSLAPGRSNAWANLGQTYAKQGKMQEAVACFANTFRFSRNRETTRQFLLRLTEKEGEDEKVKEAAKQALQLALVQASQNDLSPSSIESRENEALTMKTQRMEVYVGTYRIVRDAKLLKEPRDDADLVTKLHSGMRVNVVSMVGEKWLRVESKRADRPPGYLRTEDAVREENTVREEEEKSTPDVRASAFYLIHDYAENATVADARYKGKIIELSGSVESVQKNMGGGIIVVLAGEARAGDTLHPVQCNLAGTGTDTDKRYAEMNTKRASVLYKGQSVTLRGKGMGRDGIGFVVTDCVFVGQKE
jgi:tetratricopeptide (TPR) repeat protein